MPGKINSDEFSALAVVVCANVIKENNSLKCNKRQKWCRNWLWERQKFSHINLLIELKFEKQDCSNYLCMAKETYLTLLQTIKPFIAPPPPKKGFKSSYHKWGLHTSSSPVPECREASMFSFLF
jgi:hypothetical protein